MRRFRRKGTARIARSAGFLIPPPFTGEVATISPLPPPFTGEVAKGRRGRHQGKGAPKAPQPTSAKLLLWNPLKWVLTAAV